MMTEMKGRAVPDVKPGEMESMRIERAGNGFTVETRHKMKPVKANQVYDFEAGTKRMVFNDIEAMLDHIRQMCGGKEKKE